MAGRTRLSDLVLAGVATTLLVVQVATDNLSGSLWVAVPGGLGLGCCVLVRRAHPWIALVAACATVLAVSVLGVAQEGNYGTIVAVFVVLYTLAAQASALEAAGALGFALVAVFLAVMRTGAVKSSFAVFVLGGAVVIGRTVGNHRELAECLHATVEELNARRDEMIAAGVAAEKVKIARELHDVIAHAVSVMVIQAAAAEELLDVGSDRARAPLASVQASGRQALGELRRLLAVLRSGAEPAATLSPQPGLADLPAVAATLRDAGVAVHLQVDGDVASLPPGVDLAAYRVVQEALTNVLKHAGASTVAVDVRCRLDRIELEVADNGGGPTTEAAAGQGLVGMRERVAAYGGWLRAGPRQEGGFIVRAHLDVPRDR